MLAVISTWTVGAAGGAANGFVVSGGADCGKHSDDKAQNGDKEIHVEDYRLYLRVTVKNGMG